uniref:non-specific serine/threonine protein kinase n=1 Tax=Trypanosoma congolense (strain IL3000) TaxID=1068625 RepID=G0UNT8_TRYCI|nr:putative protein kinase [Trypanosoma congolense IL3000]
MEDYTLCHAIGDGAQGTVLCVKHKPTGRKLAMKVIRCPNFASVNSALKEIKVLIQLRHPHIVAYVDFFLVFDHNEVKRLLNTFLIRVKQNSDEAQGEGCDMPLDSSTAVIQENSFEGAGAVISPNEICVCLVMELCVHGDIGMIIKKSKRSFMASGLHPVPEAQILSWMKQCVAALTFIHGEGFLHRDLKPTNIFLDADRKAKIGDFGLAVATGVSQNSVVGTPLYIAPEHLLNEPYGDKVDVWGLAVVMLELITLHDQPMNRRVVEDSAAINKVVEQVVAMGFSGKIGELLRDMLRRHPDDRPSLDDVARRIDTMVGAPPILANNVPLCSHSDSVEAPRSVILVNDGDRSELVPSSAGCNSGASCRDSGRGSRGRRSFSSYERTPLSVTGSSHNTRAHFLREENSSAGRTMKWRTASLNSTLSRIGTPGRAPRVEKGVSIINPKTFGSCNNTADALEPEPIPKTSVHVPADYPTIAAALRGVRDLPHVCKVVVAGTTVFKEPLILQDDLPDNLCISGENPPPVIEVTDEVFAINCVSGRGTLENFVIRHATRKMHDSSPGGTQERGDKSAPHFAAVSVVGGEWTISRCRISSCSGSGITVSGNMAAGTVVSRCDIFDIKTAGVIILEKARGLFEKNTVKNCKLAGFLLKRESEARVRGNRVIDSSVTGIFLHNAHGTVEENYIGNSGSFGVVAKGPRTCAVICRNRILASQKAGVFCFSEAAPIILENDIARSSRAGILIKERAAPTVLRNVIHRGKEAGIYVFQDGAGVIEENEIMNNLSAGIIVTSSGCPQVIRNKICGNRYEGVWVCKDGSGTFVGNDVRGNAKGPVDIEVGCSPQWFENREE